LIWILLNTSTRLASISRERQRIREVYKIPSTFPSLSPFNAPPQFLSPKLDAKSPFLSALPSFPKSIDDRHVSASRFSLSNLLIPLHSTHNPRLFLQNPSPKLRCPSALPSLKVHPWSIHVSFLCPLSNTYSKAQSTIHMCPCTYFLRLEKSVCLPD
jgi:hypothetical protein